MDNLLSNLSVLVAMIVGILNIAVMIFYLGKTFEVFNQIKEAGKLLTKTVKLLQDNLNSLINDINTIKLDYGYLRNDVDELKTELHQLNKSYIEHKSDCLKERT